MEKLRRWEIIFLVLMGAILVGGALWIFGRAELSVALPSFVMYAAVIATGMYTWWSNRVHLKIAEDQRTDQRQQIETRRKAFSEVLGDDMVRCASEANWLGDRLQELYADGGVLRDKCPFPLSFRKIDTKFWHSCLAMPDQWPGAARGYLPVFYARVADVNRGLDQIREAEEELCRRRSEALGLGSGPGVSDEGRQTILESHAAAQKDLFVLRNNLAERTIELCRYVQEPVAGEKLAAIDRSPNSDPEGPDSEGAQQEPFGQT